MCCREHLRRFFFFASLASSNFTKTAVP
uniref:Uncharacterized protein n=1 Tax=Arundo donax TaxID=35708 RepID=A0A0A8ZFD0_ARUDO